MKLKLEYHTLTVTREKGDPRYTSSQCGWGSSESRLLFHILRQLNSKGFDLIKKRAWKDGHMLDSDQLYLRTRNCKSPKPHIYIWNPCWAERDAAIDLMKNGVTTLSIERDVFKLSKQKKIFKAIEGDECPNCHSGTIARENRRLVCKGECGQFFIS